MKREFLNDLGLEADVIDKIMKENGRDINKEKLKAEKIESELENLKSKFDGVDVKQLKEDADNWKKKYDDLND